MFLIKKKKKKGGSLWTFYIKKITLLSTLLIFANSDPLNRGHTYHAKRRIKLEHEKNVILIKT